MKKIIFAGALLFLFACGQQTPKTEVVSDVTDSTSAKPSTGTAAYDGPDVELMKKLLSSVEKADWEAARSCFSDSAVIMYNVWAPDTTQKGIPLADVLANEKADRVNWENVSYGDPIYEVVTVPSGEKYGHLWARYTAKNKKTGKAVDVPLFASYLIKDGKLQWEWAIYDSKRLE
jgi:hypothetical protein